MSQQMFRIQIKLILILSSKLKSISQNKCDQFITHASVSLFHIQFDQSCVGNSDAAGSQDRRTPSQTNNKL